MPTDYLQILRGITGGLEAGQNFRANRQLERARDQALESGQYDLESRRAVRRTRDPDSTKVLGVLDPSSVKDFQETFGDPFALKLVDWFRTKRANRRKKTSAVPTEEAGPPVAYSNGYESEQFGPPQSFPAEDFGDETTVPQYADGGRIARQRELTDQEREAEIAYLALDRRPQGRVPRMSDEQVAQEEQYIRDNEPYSPSAGGPPTRTPFRAGQPDMTDEEIAAERLYIAEQQARGGDREREATRRSALQSEMVRNGGISDDGLRALEARRANAGTLVRGGAEAEGAINEFVAPVLGPGFIPQEGAGRTRGGPQGRVDPQGAARRQAQASALPLDEAAPTPAEQPGAALPVQRQGTAQTRTAALPAQGQEQRVDFSQLDVDAKDVPNMTTDDWREYRAKLVDAARQSGRPEAIKQANDLVTQMQQEGFVSYGQQGLALQQVGNLKGAMAAYRAAFQYFPNGNDVEFGLIKDKQGQQQIVGFGRDEKTNKIVQSSQIVMTSEQVARLLENFTKPEAFRAWTKDWRDFEEGKRRFDASLKDKQGDDAFRQRKYTEVEKPLAQAQADSLASRGEADILRASKAGVSGTFRPGDLQRSEAAFRQRLELVGLTDEGKKDQLASIMSQIKAADPSTPDNVIINAVVAAERDGTLAQRLKAMGIQ